MNARGDAETLLPVPLEIERQIDQLCDEFEYEFGDDVARRIENYLERLPAGFRSQGLKALLELELELLAGRDRSINADEYRQRFPNDEQVVKWAIRRAPGSYPEQSVPMPERIGRFEVRKILGEGAYGRVYLVYDPQTDRLVALKVPSEHLFESGISVESFLEEARNAGRLKHPGLVLVYDVQTEGDRPYIVQEHIDGCNLGDWVRQKQASHTDIVRVLIEIVEAIGFAHQESLYHRDLKPSNVLVDRAGHPHVTDFGLALHERVQKQRRGEIAGSPAYMSPEQVRGETHRLDGRTDVWSIGIMMYELLLGTRPFRAATRDELYASILQDDPKPLRELNPAIPKQLERICLKCLQKLRADRYWSAADLGDDLRHWLGTCDVPEEDSNVVADAAFHSDTAARLATPPPVIPKGIRSFDQQDADFFLQLLPGPRGRDGLPDSIRFWKTRIEEANPDEAFSVGLIYGPSGCGKSSLVKAGLLPRLSPQIRSVYVEATPDDTEVRLLKALAKCNPEMPTGGSLPDALQFLREYPARGRKVLIVLDQFEQWLHTHRGDSVTQLIDALRQCDGGYVQCLLMVRDEFWMAITRFFNKLEISLREAHNSAAVDLFDRRHAKTVLAAFGRAHRALAADPGQLSATQDRFLETCVDDLAEHDRVICMRLAIFAEMMKDRSWEPGTYRQLGGSEGIRVRFLNNSFSAPSAPPENRFHSLAAQRVLQTLLGEERVDFRSHSSPRSALLAASGYADHPQDFERLMFILDNQLRLISRAVAAVDSSAVAATERSTQEPIYQLTHDYLVPAIRTWLDGKRRETRRGRAEILLEERTGMWRSRPGSTRLPHWLEWLRILLLTDVHQWTAPQRQMMRAANWRYAVRSSLIVVAIAGLLFAAAAVRHRVETRLADQRIDRFLDELRTNSFRYLPELIREMEPDYTLWSERVRELAIDGPPELRSRAAMALVRHDASQIALLTRRLLDADCDAVEHATILGELDEVGWSAGELAWPDESVKLVLGQVLRIGSVMAHFRADDEQWPQFAPILVQALIDTDPIRARPWVEAMAPVRGWLRPRLVGSFHAADSTARHRAASILANYSRLDSNYLEPRLLAELIVQADDVQYDSLAPQDLGRQEMVRSLVRRVRDTPAPLDDELDRQAWTNRRRTNAAIALVRMGKREGFWPLLRQTPGAELRSRLIEQFRRTRISYSDVLAQLDSTDEPTERQALVMALDSYRELLSEHDRERVFDTILSRFRDDRSAAVHVASEWLLKRWGYADAVAEAKQQLSGKIDSARNWFIDSHLQTMIVFSAPGTFRIGSPAYEENRDPLIEEQREVTIDYSFAISAYEFTVHQAQALTDIADPTPYDPKVSPQGDCPMNKVSMFEAMRRCRQLNELEPNLDLDQSCYPPVERISADVQLPADYHLLRGYRLPTVAEWEYTARALSATSRYFGNSDALLDQYAWHAGNAQERTWAVGLRMPNAFGLCDVYGNVYEWCHHEFGERLLKKAQSRGGGYRSTPKFLRSAMPNFWSPNADNSYIGFRTARRMPDR